MHGMMMNNHTERINRAEKDTLQYLEEDNESFTIINDALVAYRFIMDIIPETITKLFSGHIFPYTESYMKLKIPLISRSVDSIKLRSSLCGRAWN